MLKILETMVYLLPWESPPYPAQLPVEGTAQSATTSTSMLCAIIDKGSSRSTYPAPMMLNVGGYFADKELSMKTLIWLCLLTFMLVGCSSGPTSSRTADCRQLAEEMGDTMVYGDCMRGTKINKSGF